MNDDYLTRAEHAEFARRMEDENTRQNKRLEILEDNVRQISTLTAAVEKLAVNMGNMAREQEKQGNRLETLESRPGRRWDSLVDKIILAAVGALVGFLLAQIGIR